MNGQRWISIGVRRAPALVASEGASIHLLASYLRVLTDHRPEVVGGQWRLGLADANANAAVRQVRVLYLIARATPDEADFRAEVAGGSGISGFGPGPPQKFMRDPGIWGTGSSASTSLVWVERTPSSVLSRSITRSRSSLSRQATRSW